MAYNTITVSNTTPIGNAARSASVSLKNTLNDLIALQGKINSAIDNGASPMVKVNELAGTESTAKAQALNDITAQLLDFINSPGSSDTVTKAQVYTAISNFINHITG